MKRSSCVCVCVTKTRWYPKHSESKPIPMLEEKAMLQEEENELLVWQRSWFKGEGLRVRLARGGWVGGTFWAPEKAW